MSSYRANGAVDYPSHMVSRASLVSTPFIGAITWLGTFLEQADQEAVA